MQHFKNFLFDSKSGQHLLQCIVIPQRKIPARDWSKSRHVTFKIRTVACAGNIEVNYCPNGQQFTGRHWVVTAFCFNDFCLFFFVLMCRYRLSLKISCLRFVKCCSWSSTSGNILVPFAKKISMMTSKLFTTCILIAAHSTLRVVRTAIIADPAVYKCRRLCHSSARVKVAHCNTWSTVSGCLPVTGSVVGGDVTNTGSQPDVTHAPRRQEINMIRRTCSTDCKHTGPQQRLPRHTNRTFCTAHDQHNSSATPHSHINTSSAGFASIATVLDLQSISHSSSLFPQW